MYDTVLGYIDTTVYRRCHRLARRISAGMAIEILICVGIFSDRVENRLKLLKSIVLIEILHHFPECNIKINEHCFGEFVFFATHGERTAILFVSLRYRLIYIAVQSIGLWIGERFFRIDG